MLSVIGWNSYVSWSGLLQFVFVVICGAWVVCMSAFILQCV